VSTARPKVALNTEGAGRAMKPSFLLRGTSPGKTLRSVLARMYDLAIFFMRRKGGRYLQLSPSVWSRQVLFDRKQKKLVKIDLRNKSDFFTIGQIYLEDGYDLEKLRRYNDLIRFYESVVRAGKMPLIIDCGGNIGIASRYFSENYPKSKIICIEPDSTNVAQAKENNSSPNIMFMESAIGSERSCGTIVDPGLGNIAYRMSLAKDGATEIVAINDLLAEYSADEYTPFMIKIDIEGFESELFSKNIEWIEKFPLMIIELHDWMLPKSNNAHNFLTAVAPLNRDFVFYGEDVFSISNTLI
jgi:FkbM family methyltransferase